MPLKLSLRPGEKFVVNGAVVQNGDRRAALAQGLDRRQPLVEADQRMTALTDKHKAEIASLNDVMTALRNEVESFRGQVERQALDLSNEKTAHANTVAALQEERIARLRFLHRLDHAARHGADIRAAVTADFVVVQMVASVATGQATPEEAAAMAEEPGFPFGANAPAK